MDKYELLKLLKEFSNKDERCKNNCINCKMVKECGRLSLLVGKFFDKGNQIELIESILAERISQDLKWGEQNHLPQWWTGILGEEYGELCQAINETVFDNGTDKGGYLNMKKEAIQVAAVALSFLECLERNKGKWGM